MIKMKRYKRLFSKQITPCKYSCNQFYIALTNKLFASSRYIFGLFKNTKWLSEDFTYKFIINKLIWFDLILILEKKNMMATVLWNNEQIRVNLIGWMPDCWIMKLNNFTLYWPIEFVDAYKQCISKQLTT